MPHLTRRQIVIGAVSIVVVGLLALSMAPRPVPADMAVLERGDLLVTVDDEGETRLIDAYVVSAPVAGRVLRIEIEVGDEIRGGDTVLATFEPSDPAMLDVRSRSEAESEVRAAEAATGLAFAERDRAKAEMDFAQAELKRAQPLADRGTISEAALDRARLEVQRATAAFNTAAANVNVRQSNLELARARLMTATDVEQGRANGEDSRFIIPVRAPVDGRVMRLMQESEAVVAAGTPILEVGNPSELEIVVDLLSSDAVKVTPGDRVIIEEWGGAEDLSGEVRRVEPFGFTKISALGIEEQRVNTVIDFTTPREAWTALGHGYRVELRVVIEEREDTLRLPIPALFRSGEDWSVFVNDDGRARLRTVELGLRNTLYAEVQNGLAAGDEVILHPSDRVVDGVRVRARPSS